MKHEGSISNLVTPEIITTLGERFKDYPMAQAIIDDFELTAKMLTEDK